MMKYIKFNLECTKNVTKPEEKEKILYNILQNNRIFYKIIEFFTK